MEIEEFNHLVYKYQNSSIRICVEKCCGYKFIFFLNDSQNLNDLYNYVVSFYSHVTKPIHLYTDYNRKNEVPNNQLISVKNYLREMNILSSSTLNVPVVYKFYMDFCSKDIHKDLHMSVSLDI
tara:strand:+ start:744 stop:1112 length:369 start_codon:yes stop_codon:yes gene_type:complete